MIVLVLEKRLFRRRLGGLVRVLYTLVGRHVEYMRTFVGTLGAVCFVSCHVEDCTL